MKSEADEVPTVSENGSRDPGDSQVSVCGTATRKSGEDHYEVECRARGHTICVVCGEFIAAMGLSE